MDGSLSSSGHAANDCWLDLDPTEVYQQSSWTPLVTGPHLTLCAGDGGLVHQSFHPNDRVLHLVTFSAGHQAPGSEELEASSNSCTKTVLPGSCPPTQGMDKAGLPTLVQEARPSLPQLVWVGPSEKQPALAFSFQQFREYCTSRYTKGQSGKKQPVVAVSLGSEEQPAMAVLPPMVQHPLRAS